MPDQPKWKTALLGCGLPLELEAARLLVSKGLRVDSDFRFSPTDAAGINDYSVDLHAKASVPFSAADEATGTVDLLLECRHRRPDATWLFLPDPNEPGQSPAPPGGTIRVVDKFSSYTIDANATAAFDAELPICSTGIEIGTERGTAYDSELTRGIAQLQYALPRLLVETVSDKLGSRPSENVPFLFCPILLTTARLLVADKAMGVSDVEQATELGELAAEVPYLAVYCDYGPDFESHCQREFHALEALESDDNTLIVERRRAAHYKSAVELPIGIMESLIAAHRYWLHRLCTQFVVCTQSELPALVEAIKRAVESAVQSRKEL